MKWVKLAALVLAVLILVPVVCLAIANAGADSNRITTSVVIHQKPEAIWPYLYQPDKVKQWVTWLVEVRGEGEPAVGKNVVWVMEDKNNGGAKMEIAATVEAVEAQRRLALRLKAAEGFTGTNVYTLVPLADGSTRLESDGRYMFDNSFARFMTPLICWQAKKKMVGDLETLKTRVEGGV